jgi:haloalkane dehalogenase
MMPPKRRVEVLGRSMAYAEEGAGNPIVLLHGNLTSSYLWRNIWPYVVPFGRCIAPDLIGMGDSEKLPGVGDERYRFVEHRRYLAGLLAALEVDRHVTLVLHDWGSALGFDWANHHREAIAGIVYMESFVRPLNWDDWPKESRETFRRLRSAEGEFLVLEENLFVERMLERHPIDAEGAVEYRRPFRESGESRRPTLTWPRQIPIGGEPADVVEIVAAYSAWLASRDVPKLFVNADPGSILVGAQREFCRTWPNQEEVTVRGGHFVQEWSPDEVGAAVARWLRRQQERAA